MKKSTAVTLLISGALMAGCNDRSNGNGDWTSGNDQTNITNNTYAPGYGYWHAPYHSWYPYPYDYYRPGFGYYHGGFYSPAPERSAIVRSSPIISSGGFARGSSSSSSAHSGISRGGFGGSAHGGGGE